VATFALQTDVRFATAEDRMAFTEELANCMARLVAKYHDDETPGGFGEDAWKDEIATLDSGWRAFLATLRNYIERHRGESRTVAHFRHPVVPLPRPDAFQRMLTAFGFDRNATMTSGDRFDVTTKSGDRFQGVVDVSRRP